MNNKGSARSKTLAQSKSTSSSKALVKKQRFTDRNILFALAILSLAMFTLGTWRNGFAYTYYSAATQAATKSWKAFFYGSFDSANFMTVDKPPLAIWMSAIFTRTFSFTPFWILLPHALAGVGSTCLLYKIVKRQFDSRTALLAALIFLIAPVTCVVFRYNITDSFLTLFLLASIYFFMYSLETSKLRWLLLCGGFIGLAFNTKMSQGLIVVPIFISIYLYSSNQKFKNRIRDVLAFCLTVGLTSFWWIIIVWATPSSQRPYIGSTKTNSIFELVFVHNGFGRFFGSHWKQPTGATTGIAFGGKIGVLRIFNDGFGPNIAWFLLPAILGIALYFYVVPSSDSNRLKNIQAYMWLSFILIHVAIFSITKGTIHPYYVIVLAPGCAALCAISISLLWNKFVKPKLLFRVYIVFLLMPGITLAIFVPKYLFGGPKWAIVLGVISLATFLASVSFFIAFSFFKIGKSKFYSVIVSWLALVIVPVTLSVVTIFSVQYGFVPTTQPIPKAIGQLRKPAQQIPGELRDFLLINSSNSKWVAITTSSIAAAPIQLSTSKPVIAIGGFSGEDDSLSIEKLKQLVIKGEVRYFVFDLTQSNGASSCLGRVSNISNINRDLIETTCTTKLDEKIRSTQNITEWVRAFKRVDLNDSSNRNYIVYDLANLEQVGQ